MPWLTREALHRVLQSLISAELLRGKGGKSQAGRGLVAGGTWPETLALGEVGSPSLGCDSLDLLWLAAAVNEMFCLYDAKVENSLLTATTFGGWLDIVETGWNAGGRRITFSTSGSSGVPKRCTHEMTSLQVEIEFLAERFASARRIVALTPPHHIYGFLFTAMLPTRLGVPVLAGEALSPGILTAELVAGDLIVSIPPRWDWVDRSTPNWPGGVRGVTSTAPMPEGLKSALLQHGLESLTEVYGSSETAGVGLRTSPEQRYALMPHWTWADRNAVPPTVQDSSGRTIALQDELEIATDGSFTVKARVDGAVQVGGVNVFPGRLEEMLRAMAGVADASVRLASDVGRGRLKAFVVPDGSVSQNELAEGLEAWAATLPAPERVRSFTFGRELPRTAMGKLADWQTGDEQAV